MGWQEGHPPASAPAARDQTAEERRRVLNWFPPSAGIPREDRVSLGPAGGLAVTDVQFGVKQLSGLHVSGTLNMMSAAQTAIAMAVERLWLAPLVLRFDTQVESMSLNVTTAGLGAEFQLGYYIAGEDGYPTGLPVWTSSTLLGNSTGTRTESLPSVYTLKAGVYYWLGVNSGTTGCTVRAYSSGSMRVLSSVGTASNQRNSIYVAQTLGSWRDFSASPVTSGNLTITTCPQAFFTVA